MLYLSGFWDVCVYAVFGFYWLGFFYVARQTPFGATQGITCTKKRQNRAYANYRGTTHKNFDSVQKWALGFLHIVPF
jgi:hypothetical protein